MKTATYPMMLVALAICSLSSGTRAEDQVYLEFLWEAVAPDALARSEAYGFTLEPVQDHRVCVVALTDWGQNDTLSMEISDASGQVVGRRVHDDFRGSKRCYKLALDSSGSVGTWTFKAYVNEVLAGTKQIEVARTLDEAPFYTSGSSPYALGRPNYDASIPADEYIGRLVWVMQVGAAGAVIDVEVESAEGAGDRMRERAVAAGRLTRFPPDPSRAVRPFKVRQEYVLGGQPY